MMLTRFFQWLGISRDSAWFYYGKLAGIIIFVASMGAEAAHNQLGLSPVVFHVVQIASGWIAIISAQQSTSKLNGGSK